MTKELIANILDIAILVFIIGIVFYDAYAKRRYNVKASILWAISAGFLPSFSGIFLYLLFRPRRDTNLTPATVRLGIEETKCTNHNEIRAERLCGACRYAYCQECLTEVKNKSYCQSCLDFQDKKYRVLNKILTVFSLIFVILLTVMLGFVVPALSGMFKDLGGELPILTQIMIKISSFAWIIGLLSVALIAFLFRNTKCTNLLKKLAPISYIILFILIWAIPLMLITLIVASIFLPLYNISMLVS